MTQQTICKTEMDINVCLNMTDIIETGMTS